MEAKLPACALIAGLAASAALAAAPGIPSEVPGFETMARELRSPITLKIQDLRSTLPMREIAPGVVEFRESGGKLIGTLKIIQQLDATSTQRFEEVSYTVDNGRMALRERITTKGTGLKLTNPVERIFFSDQGPYLLKKDETEKIVSIFMGNTEINRFVIRKTPLPNGDTSNYQEIYFAGVKMLTIDDIVSRDETARIADYVFHERAVLLAVPGYRSRNCCFPTGTYRISSSRPSGYLIDSHRFFARGMEKFSLDDFISDYGKNVYEPMFGKYGAKTFMKGFVEMVFPGAVRRVDSATTSPFLLELLNMRNQVEQAPSNPSLLSQVSQRLTLIINAIRSGDIQVNDSRQRTP